MITVDLHQVAPADLRRAAVRWPASLLLCQFKTPPSPTALSELVVQLSSGVVVDQEPIRTVRFEPSATDSTALSLAKLDVHTDGAFLAVPPSRIILSCTRTDPGGGGVSTLVPVEQILDAAPGWALSALSAARYLFPRTYDGDLTDSFVGPVLAPGDDGRMRIRWRADAIYRPQVHEANGTRAADAAAWLHAYLDECQPFSHLLGTGELILIPNGLFLHGRRALSPGSEREILRAWIF